MVDINEDDEAMDDVDMTMDSNDTTDGTTTANGLSQQQPSSSERTPDQQRFSAWIFLATANIVSIIAVLLRRHRGTAAEKWSIAIVSISLVFSLLSCLAHQIPVARGMFVSEPVELCVSTFLFLLWCAGLAIIMNPSNSIAVGFTQIVNANLYVGAWVSFLCLFWMQTNLWGERYNYRFAGVWYSHVQTRQGKWQALLASSLVVLSASVRVFRSFECTLPVMTSSPTCHDSRVAIAVSVVASLISILVSLLGCVIPASILQIGEYVGSFLMLGFWCVGLGFITFGEGPGHSIGNLFFATWTAFLLSGLIAGECFIEWRSSSTVNSFYKQNQTELPEFTSSRAPNVHVLDSNEAVHYPNG
ncbi:hypothetical protein IV203_031594 [Nitzschia inconspicua]|uniref:Uncharacterized protein n=1 Tax=Nitzschia inconspicua TaxID=303405 RepID=A0A9K3LYD9_9STRA|nr:hypothetical protein IV203_031594 [Nitzschia inconspicua]